MTRKYLYFEDLSFSLRSQRDGNRDVPQVVFKRNAYEQRRPNVLMLSRGEFKTRQLQTTYPISVWDMLVPKMGNPESQQGQIWRSR